MHRLRLAPATRPAGRRRRRRVDHAARDRVLKRGERRPRPVQSSRSQSRRRRISPRNARVVGRLRNGFCNGRRRRSGLGRRVVVVVDGREGRAETGDVRGPRGVVAAAGEGASRPRETIGPVPSRLPRGQALVPGGLGRERRADPSGRLAPLRRPRRSYRAPAKYAVTISHNGTVFFRALAHGPTVLD